MAWRYLMRKRGEWTLGLILICSYPFNISVICPLSSVCFCFQRLTPETFLQRTILRLLKCFSLRQTEMQRFRSPEGPVVNDFSGVVWKPSFLVPNKDKIGRCNLYSWEIPCRVWLKLPSKGLGLSLNLYWLLPFFCSPSPTLWQVLLGAFP